MKYAHIGENNKLLGWYTDDIHSEIPIPNIQVTEEQWQEALSNSYNKINPDGSGEVFDFRTTEELLEQKKVEIRRQRNEKLKELDAFVSNPFRFASFTDEQKAELATYRQALLDVPQQAGFPSEVVWPEKPTFI